MRAGRGGGVGGGPRTGPPPRPGCPASARPRRRGRSAVAALTGFLAALPARPASRGWRTSRSSALALVRRLEDVHRRHQQSRRGGGCPAGRVAPIGQIEPRRRRMAVTYPQRGQRPLAAPVPDLGRRLPPDLHPHHPHPPVNPGDARRRPGRSRAAGPRRRATRRPAGQAVRRPRTHDARPDRGVRALSGVVGMGVVGMGVEVVLLRAGRGGEDGAHQRGAPVRGGIQQAKPAQRRARRARPRIPSGRREQSIAVSRVRMSSRSRGRIRRDGWARARRMPVRTAVTAGSRVGDGCPVSRWAAAIAARRRARVAGW